MREIMLYPFSIHQIGYGTQIFGAANGGMTRIERMNGSLEGVWFLVDGLGVVCLIYGRDVPWYVSTRAIALGLFV
jgi:hypothetical protein